MDDKTRAMIEEQIAQYKQAKEGLIRSFNIQMGELNGAIAALQALVAPRPDLTEQPEQPNGS